MAQFPGITLTNAGLNMIAESQASGLALIFTNLKMGDGLLTPNEDIKKFITVKNALLEAPIESFKNQGNGQIKLRFAISNGSLETGFFAREIGIYAKIGETGAEQLYAYANAGNLTDYIPDKNTPIDEQIIDIYVVVGNAKDIKVISDGSIMYVTKADLSDHNIDINSHPDIREIIKKAGAMPLGTIMPFLMTAPPPGWLALDTGAILTRETYPDLWKWVEKNAPLISEADWQKQAAVQSSVGYYSSGDGSTTFRLPRILDYVRGGTQDSVGTWQGDAIRNITGSIFTDNGWIFTKYNDVFHDGGHAGNPNTRAATDKGAFTTKPGIYFDASRVVPTADENRPKTIKMLYCVKAFDTLTDQSLVDITALANSKLNRAGDTATGILQLADNVNIATDDNSGKLATTNWISKAVFKLIAKLANTTETGVSSSGSFLGVNWLISEHGYVSFGKLFGGLIVQWGYTYAPVNYIATAIFPIKFSNNLYAITGIGVSSAAGTTHACDLHNVEPSRAIFTSQYSNLPNIRYIAVGW